MTIKEAVEQIKKAKNTRVAHNPNTGEVCTIEVQTEAGWATLPLKNLTARMAEDIIRQADNKLLLG